MNKGVWIRVTSFPRTVPPHFKLRQLFASGIRQKIPDTGACFGFQRLQVAPVVIFNPQRHISTLLRSLRPITLWYTQEELDDEILNRQAAQARVALIEQAMAKLQGDLKKAKEQLVQTRMEVWPVQKTSISHCPPVYIYTRIFTDGITRVMR